MGPTTAASSTVTTSSSVSSLTLPLSSPFHHLEISVISAQDLCPISKSMRTYAVTWIDPAHKLTTRTDQGHKNPTWNEKFDFHVANESLLSEDTSVIVEIYAASRVKDTIVGTVTIPMRDLIRPLVRMAPNHYNYTRFVALQVSRPSGVPEGILNMGVSFLENKNGSHHNQSEPDNLLGALLRKAEEEDHENERLSAKIQLWRSLSTGSEVMNNKGEGKDGSMVNGSMVNGSELCSDIGPSASIVAAELALSSKPPMSGRQSSRRMIKFVHDVETGSSILGDLTAEEAKSKGYRVRSRDGRKSDFDDQSALSNTSQIPRRNSDVGLFSCFGKAYGIEFNIVCGSGNKGGSKISNGSKSRSRKSSSTNSV